MRVPGKGASSDYRQPYHSPGWQCERLLCDPVIPQFLYAFLYPVDCWGSVVTRDSCGGALCKGQPESHTGCTIIILILVQRSLAAMETARVASETFASRSSSWGGEHVNWTWCSTAGRETVLRSNKNMHQLPERGMLVSTAG